MIDKVTNTQCRSKFLFFLLTLYKSLNSFLSGTSTAIFTLQILFSTVFGEEDEKGRLGLRPVGKMNTMFCLFVPRCAFFPEGSEMPILWLKPPFNESRTRVNEQEFTLVWQDSRWVLSLACTFLFFVMSSCRKPACYWFCLWQELPTEGE